MTSILTVIRDAVRPGASPLSPLENNPGAETLLPETPQLEAPTPGGDMTANQSAPGAAPAVAGTIAAVAAAASGGSDGFKSAMDRIDAIVSAEGIKGDAGRMSAALDLAKASPDMAAEAVVAFVTGNVSAANAGTPAPAAAAPQPSYEQQRLAAANLAMPSGATAQKETVAASWKDAIAKAGVGRKGV